jgi:phage gpG-like protein
MREPLSLSVIEVMMPSIRANFQAEGRPPWEPLSPVTIQFRNGATGPILHRTGNLQRAATSFKIWSISNTSATVKNLPSSVWYGVLHQEGFGGFKPFMQAAQSALGSKASFRDITRHAFELLDAARGGATSHRKITIPQRQFIMYQDEDIDSIQEVFADWMEREARRVGRFGTAVRGL